MNLPQYDLDKLRKIQILVKMLRAYHRHEVNGIENFPKEGPCIIGVNHSLATYDISLLLDVLFEQYGRVGRPLIDRLFFKLPYVGEFMKTLGAMEGSPENAKKILALGEIMVVAPGGMREALRPSSEKYQIRWQRRMGFARISIEEQVPIVLACCPKADDLYTVYQNALTSWAYKFMKVPLFLASGWGYTPLPKPAKLVHYLSEPIYPPARINNKELQNQQLERYHHRLLRRMVKLLQVAIEKETLL